MPASYFPLEISDQTGNTVYLSGPPQKIISLVPSQTELLFDLGLNEEIAGITKFCVHPAEYVRLKAKIGGTKNLNLEKIKSLQPDLIIANKEENEKGQVEELKKYFPVWTSDVKDLGDALVMILQIGKLVNRETTSKRIYDQIKLNFKNLSPHNKPSPSLLYLLWRNPYMTAGSDTFINDMILRCGFSNVCDHKKRYPEISTTEIKSLNPSIVFLSSEPYPFGEKHTAEIKDLLPGSIVMVVDGEFFSWYGSRLLKATGYFEKLINDIQYNFIN